MAFTLDNFVRSTLQADITAGATTVTVTKAAPPLRDPPTASAAAPGLMVLQDVPASPTKIEVISYTGRSIVGTVVTLTGVTRGMEGSTASPWSAGAPTFGGMTAGVVADLQAQVTGKEPAITAGTTAQYRRGDKTWRDFATDVRAAVLSGLSTATNAAITAADTVLSALGKLQAQLSGKANLTGAAFTGLVSATNLSGTNTGDQTSVTGNAGTATKLATARTLALGGLLGGSASFDGSGDVTITATMADGALSIAKISGLQAFLDSKAVLTSGNLFLAFTQAIDTPSGGIWQINVSGVPIGGIRANSTTIMLFGSVQPIALRPNGGGSTAGQVLIGTDGSVAANGNVTTTGTIAASNLSGTNTGDQNLAPYALLSGAAFTGLVSATNLSGTNTGDQTSVTGNAGTATKLQTPRAISGVNFDGSAAITIPYSGLSGLPALGTAAAQNTAAFATAAQGAKADSAVQPNTAVSLTSITIGGGKKISKVTLGTSIPASLADGELYLQYS